MNDGPRRRSLRDRFVRFRTSTVRRTGTALVRFPIAVVAILLAALIANIEIADDGTFGFDSFVRLQMACYAAAVSSIAVTLILEARGRGSLLRYGLQAGAATAFAGAVWFGLAWSVHAPALIFAITLFLPLSPYVGRSDGAAFWTFAARTFVGTLFAFAAVLVFVFGIVAIVEMAAFLFEFEVAANVNEHIVVTALSLVGPLFALGRIPSSFDDHVEIGAGDQLIRGFALLAGWVAAPLALVAAIVLHLYAVKILVGGTVPRGEIGWIVSFYVLLTVLLRVSTEPIRGIAGAALNLFFRVWAWLLVLPLALLGWAVFLRIEAEGVTIARYFLALEAITTAILVCLAIAFRRRIDVRWLVGLPILAIFLASFGPQGVAESVGRSQVARIAPFFAGNGHADAGFSGLSDPQRAELRTRIYALAEVGQLGRLAAMTDDRILAGSQRPYDMARTAIAALGLASTDDVSGGLVRQFERPAGLDVTGFDRIAYDREFVRRDGSGSGQPVTDGAGAEVPVMSGFLDGDALVMTLQDQESRFPFDPDDLVAGSGASPTPRIVTLRSDDGRAVLGLLVLSLTTTGEGRIVAIRGDVFSRSADWRSR